MINIITIVDLERAMKLVCKKEQMNAIVILIALPSPYESASMADSTTSSYMTASEAAWQKIHIAIHTGITSFSIMVKCFEFL